MVRPGGRIVYSTCSINPKEVQNSLPSSYFFVTVVVVVAVVAVVVAVVVAIKSRVLSLKSITWPLSSPE